MKNKLLLLIVGMFLVSLVSATDNLGTFKENQNIVLIQGCDNSTYSNISKITYPNSSLAISTDTVMLGDEFYNYTFTHSSTLGTYLVYGHCNEDGIDTQWAYSFDVTTSGYPTPDGFIVIFFSSLLIIIMGLMVYELIKGIGHFASLDMDVLDVARNIGLYFAVLVIYQLGKAYFFNPIFDSWIEIIINFGWITHVVVPIIGFVLSITVGSLSKKKVDLGVNRIYRKPKMGGFSR